MWNADDKMMLSVKTNKENMMGNFQELEKQHEESAVRTDSPLLINAANIELGSVPNCLQD